MTPDPIRQSNPMLPVLAGRRGWPRHRPAVRRWRLAERFRAGRIDTRRPLGVIFRHDGRTVRQIPASRRQPPRPVTFAPQFRLVFQMGSAPGRQTAPPIRRGEAESVPSPPQVVSGFPVFAPRGQSIARQDVRVLSHRDGIVHPLARTGVTLVRENAQAAPVSTLREIARSVSERIVREHRRTENRQQATTVIREQPSVAAEVERALTNAARPGADVQGQPSMAGTISPANGWLIPPTGDDLDRLTDRIVTRIDDRLTAQRERMGRVF